MLEKQRFGLDPMLRMRSHFMSVHDLAVPTLDGGSSTLGDYRGHVLLVVNVASKCGYTPQYAGLQALQTRYADRGFSVLGFPCNQFLFQEPGDAASITTCGVDYGVTFPVFGKVKVNGRQRHPLYALLATTPDSNGKAGRVRWNFEKVLIGREGVPRTRFRTKMTPEDPRLLAAVEEALAE